MHDVWVARLTDEEMEKAAGKILDQMREELESIWKDLKEEFLKEGG